MLLFERNFKYKVIKSKKVYIFITVHLKVLESLVDLLLVRRFLKEYVEQVWPLYLEIVCKCLLDILHLLIIHIKVVRMHKHHNVPVSRNKRMIDDRTCSLLFTRICLRLEI
jgi:hypothetical protein